MESDDAEVVGNIMVCLCTQAGFLLDMNNEMRQKIDTVEGRKMYSKRMKIVEPVFGNVKAQKEMDRFTLRGRKKVNVQWRLFCIVHNIEKILHYGKTWAKVA